MVRKADHARSIHHDAQWHTAELEEVDLLPIAPSDDVLRIRKAYERQAFCAPIQAEDAGAVRSYCQYLGTAMRESHVIIPKARQLRATIWSEEPTQECKDDQSAPVVRESDEAALRVTKLEVRCEFAGSIIDHHIRPVPWHLPKSHRTYARLVCP